MAIANLYRLERKGFSSPSLSSQELAEQASSICWEEAGGGAFLVPAVPPPRLFTMRLLVLRLRLPKLVAGLALLSPQSGLPLPLAVSSS